MMTEQDVTADDLEHIDSDLNNNSEKEALSFSRNHSGKAWAGITAINKKEPSILFQIEELLWERRQLIERLNQNQNRIVLEKSSLVQNCSALTSFSAAGSFVPKYCSISLKNLYSLIFSSKTVCGNPKSASNMENFDQVVLSKIDENLTILLEVLERWVVEGKTLWKDQETQAVECLRSFQKDFRDGGKWNHCVEMIEQGVRQGAFLPSISSLKLHEIPYLEAVESTLEVEEDIGESGQSSVQ